MIYFKVMEYDPEGNSRRIYTFDNEPAAWELVELLLRLDKNNLIGVEEHEVTT